MMRAVIVLKWLLLLMPHAVMVGVAWALAPVVVRRFSTADKLHLRRPFRWMETIDHDLRGDVYWQVDHLGGADPLSDEARIAWVRRNGGNAVNYGLLGVLSDSVWLAQYRSTYHGVISGGPVWWQPNAFCMRKVIVGFMVDAGWNLLGPQNGRCKYWFSVRRERQGKS